MKFTCTCGKKTTVLRFYDGVLKCSACAPLNLSGTFLRHLEGEKQYYAADILQKGDKGFEELYGKGKNIRIIKE